MPIGKKLNQKLNRNCENLKSTRIFHSLTTLRIMYISKNSGKNYNSITYVQDCIGSRLHKERFFLLRLYCPSPKGSPKRNLLTFWNHYLTMPKPRCVLFWSCPFFRSSVWPWQVTEFMWHFVRLNLVVGKCYMPSILSLSSQIADYIPDYDLFARSNISEILS